jgi:hypothetical protein
MKGIESQRHSTPLERKPSTLSSINAGNSATTNSPLPNLDLPGSPDLNNQGISAEIGESKREEVMRIIANNSLHENYGENNLLVHLDSLLSYWPGNSGYHRCLSIKLKANT